MLDLKDSHWSRLLGGRRIPYDPRAALATLESGERAAVAWEELWDGLHHQGDVDTAAYATVPHLVRIHEARDVQEWNTFALMGIVEQVRHSDRNPEIPPFLREGYEQAWERVEELALRDLQRSREPLLTRAALGILAMARGLRRAGEILLDFTEDELEEMVSAYRGESP